MPEDRDAAKESGRRGAMVGVLRLALVTMVGAIAALVATGLVAETGGNVGPGKVVLSARAQLDGHTQLQLPPVGRVTASTHGAPVALEARIDEVDIDAVQAVLSDTDPEQRLAEEVRQDLQPLLRRFIIRCLAVGALAGAVGALLVLRGRSWHILAGAIGGLVAVAAMGGLTWRQFDVDAFGHPRFQGAIERAPAILSAARRHVQGFEQVRDRVRGLGAQVADLYAITAQGGLESTADETTILHVSDIHSNPLGVEVARRLAESFGADAILDTGDLTSFGYPIEARVGDLIRAIPVPYLFVPGNHDSADNRTALAAVANLNVLTDGIATIGGVRILGVADPSFTASNEVDPADAADIKARASPAVASRASAERPEVLAVHDRRLAEDAIGKVPVVVVGHLHQRGWSREGGTLVLTVGSTGATGLGSFTIETHSPYEAELLHFRQGKLEVVDYVTLRGVSGEFSVDRRLATQR